MMLINYESGRRELNPRPSPWQGDVLPLNHSRSHSLFKILSLKTSWQVYPVTKLVLLWGRRSPPERLKSFSRAGTTAYPVAIRQLADYCWETIYPVRGLLSNGTPASFCQLFEALPIIAGIIFHATPFI